MMVMNCKRMLDIQGNVVLEVRGLTSNHYVLDRRDLESGIYFILLEGGGTSYSSRLLIE